MGDVASLAVGLHLNAANFKSQLMSAYGSAESQSRQFNRNARADAKKTEDAYKRVSASVSGLAGRLAGWQVLPGRGYRWAPLSAPRGSTASRCRICRLSPVPPVRR